MIEKLCSCLLIIAFIIPCVFILLNSAEYVDNFNKVSLPFNDFADKIAVSALSEVEKLGELAPALLYTISPSQQDGIFITDQYLLEDVIDENQNWRQNSLAIKEFAENVDIPVYPHFPQIL